MNHCSKLFLIFTFGLLTFSTSSTAQKKSNLLKKVTHKFLSSTKDSTRSPSFMAIPALSYAQETGFEIGVAGTYDFYMDRSDLQSKTSNLMLIATVTTENQKKLNLTSDIWTKNNEYHIITDIRVRDWPFNFYGIGNNTWEADKDRLDQTLYRIKLDVEKNLAPNVYIGLNANYDNYKFNDIVRDGIFESENINGKTGGQFLALGLSALYDSRNKTTYTSKGLYGRIKYAYAPRIFGQEDFKGSLLETDIRGYIPLSSKVNIATQALYRGTYGHNAPFYVMRDLGGDMSMRGYYLGRYKDNNYATVQAELRYRPIPRFGLTAFSGTGSTFSKDYSPRLVPSYGAGIRYFFSLEHSSTIRLDYAFGEQRAGEKRQSGFYLSISEAF